MKADGPSLDAPNLVWPPVHRPDGDRIALFLNGMVSAGASSQEVAEAVGAAFGGLDEALGPIIGARGVAALYKRSLHLASRKHDWLPPLPDDVSKAIDVQPLISGLMLQTAVRASSAGIEVLEGFHSLLTSLIGTSLTERLLRPMWAKFLSGPAARDTVS